MASSIAETVTAAGNDIALARSQKVALTNFLAQVGEAINGDYVSLSCHFDEMWQQLSDAEEDDPKNSVIDWLFQEGFHNSFIDNSPSDEDDAGYLDISLNRQIEWDLIIHNFAYAVALYQARRGIQDRHEQAVVRLNAAIDSLDAGDGYFHVTPPYTADQLIEPVRPVIPAAWLPIQPAM
jgi:hypothetical protein